LPQERAVRDASRMPVLAPRDVATLLASLAEHAFLALAALAPARRLDALHRCDATAASVVMHGTRDFVGWK
jgi:hypothetical protein